MPMPSLGVWKTSLLYRKIIVRWFCRSFDRVEGHRLRHLLEDNDDDDDNGDDNRRVVGAPILVFSLPSSSVMKERDVR
jgi:hypothetical protein